jgi:hypothetical protein
MNHLNFTHTSATKGFARPQIYKPLLARRQQRESQVLTLTQIIARKRPLETPLNSQHPGAAPTATGSYGGIMASGVDLADPIREQATRLSTYPRGT